MQAATAKLPLRFEENVGQVNGPEARDVRYISRGSAYSLFLTSKEAVLGTYQALPKATSKLVLLDFSKVDYINSSGIALVIQLLIEAANSGQKVIEW